MPISTRRQERQAMPPGDSTDDLVAQVVLVESSTARRSSRRIQKEQVAVMDEPHNANHNDNDDVQDDDEDHSQQEPQQQYILDGVEYDSYQEMVDAKRKRNQQVLQGLGFLDSTKAPKLQKASSSSTKSQASQRGIKRQKVVETEPAFKRTSSRLSGVKTGHVALDYNAVNWSSGKADKMIVQVEGEGGVGDGNVAGGVVRVVDNYHEKAPTYFNGRVNDGSDLTITDAVELVERKWVKDDSVEAAVAFAKNLVVRQNAPPQKQTSTKKNSKLLAAADSYDDLQPKFNALSIDKEEWVAKVTPDRIYSVSAHPSESKLIVAAGDKQGYVGLWDVDHYASATTTDNNNHHHHNGVYLFRPHARPICCLEWSSPSTLISASYDGTVRCFNAETETFTELFATYDDSNTFYIEELGYGLDQGYRYWTQSVSLDTRNSANRSNPCLFLSTSVGTAMHVDLRIKDKQKITFHETLSEKKINTLSLHPNGYTLASAGNDGMVQLWDIRKFGDSRNNAKTKTPKPVATQQVGLSISSAYFSPSGNSLVSTSNANRLDLFNNAHLEKGKMKATYSINHNNQTGRWLSTFMATWHPQLDIFVVGSMNRPRSVEAYDAQGKQLVEVRGEALGSVMSRCCFHPSTDKIIMVGGNSSGRVVAIR